jgi:hypothetical protein
MNVELHKSVIDLLASTYDIKFAMDCRNFDLNYKALIDKLLPLQSSVFNPKEKILLVHMDTDYYDPLLPCGMIPINVVRIFDNLDIPLHALLFVTNHFGIRREFDLLVKDRHLKDRPVVIETLLSPMLLNEQYAPIKEISLDKIEKAAVCMMSRQRSHRVAFYNFLLDHDLFEKVAVSQHFND